MSIEVGMRVKATCNDDEVFIGTLTHICLGMSPEESLQASIIISEDKGTEIKYGQVHLWCNGLKQIEQIEQEKGVLIEFFETLHIETEKDISLDGIPIDLVNILDDKGYRVVGNIGTTQIHHNGKKLAKNCTKAFEEHYQSIKNAW